MGQFDALEFVNDYAYNAGIRILLAEGFEKALLGVVEGAGIEPAALYDYGACVEILKDRDAMTEGEALEYMEFNVVAAARLFSFTVSR